MRRPSGDTSTTCFPLSRAGERRRYARGILWHAASSPGKDYSRASGHTFFDDEATNSFSPTRPESRSCFSSPWAVPADGISRPHDKRHDANDLSLSLGGDGPWGLAAQPGRRQTTGKRSQSSASPGSRPGSRISRIIFLRRTKRASSPAQRVESARRRLAAVAFPQAP